MLKTILSLALASSASSGEAAAPPGHADLAALMAEADARSPEIAAARSRVAAAEAIPSQMEALPDPLVSVSFTNETFDEIRLGESEDSLLTISWTQELPYPGKRGLAGDAARQEAEVSSRRLDSIRLAVLSNVKQTYADLYRIDRTTVILAENRTLLVSFLEAARARYEVGDGLLQNILKAQTEISKLDVELAKFAQERLSAQAALNALVGRDSDEPLGPALALPETAQAIDVAALEQEALLLSPEILEMEAAARRDDALLDLARRQGKPDLMWGAAYTNRGDLDPMVMGMFGVRLPLYKDRKQAQAIIQAEHELAGTKQEVLSVRLRILAQVRDLAARAGRAQAIERLYSEGVIAQARSALESAAASYGVGRVDFLTLLSDFETLLGYEIDREVQRAERVTALAALERLTARALVFPGPAPQESGVSR